MASFLQRLVFREYQLIITILFTWPLEDTVDVLMLFITDIL